MRYEGRLDRHSIENSGAEFDPNQVYLLFSVAGLIRAVRGREVLDVIGELEGEKLKGIITGPIAHVVSEGVME